MLQVLTFAGTLMDMTNLNLLVFLYMAVSTAGAERLCGYK